MLTLQFGQCGNQVGHSLFSSITSDLYATNTGVSVKSNSEYVQFGFDTWFEGLSKKSEHFARAVLIDTEQKVIKKICTRDKNPFTWTYSPQNILCQAGGGSANNWGYGYYTKGSELNEAAIDAVRKEVEKVDSFQGILSILSSAGGTGSGVGSYIMEKLRDEYPTKTFTSVIILPYASGEVGTQNYNSLLTLAKFIEITDMVLVFENDQLHSICENLMKIQNTGSDDLNQIIGHKLAAVFQPVYGTTNILSSLTYQITPHPQYKIASIKASPLTLPSTPLYNESYKWLPIFRHLKQMLRAPAFDMELIDMETKMPSRSTPSRTAFIYSKSVSNMLITRGPAVNDDPVATAELNDEKLYVDWVPRTQQFSQLHQPRRLLSKDKFATLVTNNSQLCRPIDAIVEKAWNNYVHSAFLHQYMEHGVGEDDFLQAFAKVENVVKVYQQLNGHEILS